MNIQAKCFSLASSVVRWHVQQPSSYYQFDPSITGMFEHWCFAFYYQNNKKYEAKRYIAYRCKHRGQWFQSREIFHSWIILWWQIPFSVVIKQWPVVENMHFRSITFSDTRTAFNSFYSTEIVAFQYIFILVIWNVEWWNLLTPKCQQWWIRSGRMNCFQWKFGVLLRRCFSRKYVYVRHAVISDVTNLSVTQWDVAFVSLLYHCIFDLRNIRSHQHKLLDMRHEMRRYLYHCSIWPGWDKIKQSNIKSSFLLRRVFHSWGMSKWVVWFVELHCSRTPIVYYTPCETLVMCAQFSGSVAVMSHF